MFYINILEVPMRILNFKINADYDIIGKAFIKISKMLACLLVVIGGVIAESQEVKAQNGQIIPCAPKVKGLHYTNPYYDYSPVLFPSMPYEIMFSYVLIDSMLKHAPETPGIVESLFERFDSGEVAPDNDTLNYAYKYLYKISDYDPLLFWDYVMNGQGHGRNMHAFMLYNKLTDCIEKATNGQQKRLMLRSFWILHIYVDATTVWEKYETSKDHLKDYTMVYANVLDTIKGKTLPNLNTMLFADSSNNTNSSSTKISIPNNNINLIFDYCNQWNLNGDNAHVLVIGDEVQGAMKDENGDPWIKTNREYIVLLAPNYRCSYEWQNYYALWPVSGLYSRGMYPIENGNVIDLGNVWGWGTSVPIGVFKQNLNTLINEIKNYGE